MNLKRWAIPAMALLMLSLGVPKSWADGPGGSFPPGYPGGGNGGQGGGGGNNGCHDMWSAVPYVAEGDVVMDRYPMAGSVPISARVVVMSLSFPEHPSIGGEGTSDPRKTPNYSVGAEAVVPACSPSTIVMVHAELNDGSRTQDEYVTLPTSFLNSGPRHLRVPTLHFHRGGHGGK